MLISIVIPAHNRPAFLAEAVRSIAAQTFADYEVVVVDDGSEPPISTSMLAEILRRPILLHRHQTAQGIPRAKNAGVRAARGEVILLLDDDDLLMPHALETVFRTFSHHPEIDCLFLGAQPFGPYADGPAQKRVSAIRTMLESCTVQEHNGLYFFSDGLFDTLLKTVPIDFQRPAARRGLWNIAGGFDEGLLFSESAWAIRASCLGTIALSKEPLTRWRIHDENFGWRLGLMSDREAQSRRDDNALMTWARQLETFRNDARKWRARAKAMEERYSEALLRGAYYLRHKNRLKGMQTLLRSFLITPHLKHLKLMVSYLVPRRWLERRAARIYDK